MRPFTLMSPARSREWLELCASVAHETLQVAGQDPAATWIPFEDKLFAEPIEAAAFGFLLQWACEDNASYAMTFGPIANSDQALCPFHHDGITFAANVVWNGIMDDWEIFAQWGERGYIVIPEWRRQDGDRRFNAAWAPDWLYRRCGGVRAPSELPQDTKDALHIRALELASNAGESAFEQEDVTAPACR